MPIKLRILIVVLVLQLLGYGLLLVYYARVSGKALSQMRTEQVRAIFEANAARINAQTELIERASIDLGGAGESLLRTQREHPEIDAEDWASDHLTSFVQRIPFAVGAGLWFEPERLLPGRRLFGPYAYWDKGKVVFTWDLNTEQYDYLSQSWYLHGIPSDWPRGQRRPDPAYWTKPYYDEAGTQALMMTADAPMYDDAGTLVGMATVDWSMEGMRELVAAIRPTPGSRAFMIEKQSRRFVSFVLDDGLVMQPVGAVDWGDAVLDQSPRGDILLTRAVSYGGTDYTVFSTSARIGLLFGVMMPSVELDSDIINFTRQNLVMGAVLSVFFVALVFFALRTLFRPFQSMMTQIERSISHDRVTGRLELTPLASTGRNEFTPIVRALNGVYGEVRAYTERLADANQGLEQQRIEIQRLNQSLEAKVVERTGQLEARNLELQQTIVALQNTQQQLVNTEKHVALSRMVAGIAHEVNTPLGVAVTACSHLQVHVLDVAEHLAAGKITRSELDSFVQNSREGLEILARNLARAAQLVHGFKQISVDQSSEQRRRFAVKRYLEDVVLSLRPQLKKTAHQVVIECPSALEVDSYPGAWSQILTNLLMNSLRHAFVAEQVGEMRIVVTPTPEGVELRYSDNGCGVPEENLERLFEPFFTTRRDEDGSGLGLHIVQNLVTRTLKGQIRCESQPGRGILFVLDLPTLPPDQ